MFKFIFAFSILILALTFCQNSSKGKPFSIGKYEIQGVSFVGMHYVNEEAFVKKLSEYNFTWISQMPFAFQRKNDPNVRFNFDKQWWGESVNGIKCTSDFCQKHHIKNMMKPQIWMGGEYTGKFTLKTEEDWIIWEESYSKYIFHFAHVADSLKHEAFCIGTELHQTVVNRPEFWNKIIDSIRTFYDGKLTYASNWDEYTRIPFWKKLDWIGINAYFPLSQEKTPKTKNLVSAWKKIIPKMRNFSDSVSKPIVFTEIGYKSVDFCATEPWNPQAKTLNFVAQYNAYEAFLSAFSEEQSWFKGYFIWKWYPHHEKSGGEKNDDFTPQNKVSEKLFK